MEKHEIDIPGPCSVIAGPSRGRSDQTTSLPQVSIRTVVCPGKFFRVRINLTSLTCSGWSQGICSATQLPTFRKENFPVLRSLYLPLLAEELVNLLCGLRRRECSVGLEIRVENVEDSFINDPWLLVI